MARVQTEYNGSSEGLQTVGTPMVRGAGGSYDASAEQNAARLAEAFGLGAKLTEAYAEKKVNDQKDKIQYYVETFKKDYQGGAVSQAQVRERFPETVPIIAAKIAEVMGRQEADKAFADVISEIQTNDELRLNTEARRAFIEKKRGELFGNIPQGNDFYANGFASGMNALQQQYETTWLNETAKYHQEVQTEGFRKDLTSALYKGGDLTIVDQMWGKSSSLNNIERKKIAADTVVDVAIASRDETILDRVPTIFRSSENNAKFEQARARISELKMADIRNARTLDEWNREQTIRKGKQSIIEQLANGQNPSPMQYKDHPELVDFAIQARSWPIVEEGVAASNVRTIKDSILNQATFGTTDVKKLEAQILTAQGINNKDRKALVDELPKLLEGRRMMSEDSDIKGAANTRLAPLLSAIESSTVGGAAIMNGRNLRAEVFTAYEQGVNARLKAHYEANGNWPNGFEKQKYINEALVEAEALFKTLSDLRNAREILRPNPSGAAPKATPQAQPQGQVRKFNPATGKIE